MSPTSTLHRHHEEDTKVTAPPSTPAALTPPTSSLARLPSDTCSEAGSDCSGLAELAPGRAGRCSNHLLPPPSLLPAADSEHHSSGAATSAAHRANPAAAAAGSTGSRPARLCPHNRACPAVHRSYQAASGRLGAPLPRLQVGDRWSAAGVSAPGAHVRQVRRGAPP
jgi:hypothetical protein